MSQIINTRKHTTISFSANDKVVEELSRGGLIREIYLNLSLTPTDATNAYANIKPGDEWSVIKKITLMANGTKAIRSISGEALRMYNMFVYGKMPKLSPLLGAGGANPVCNSTVILPLWSVNSIRPIDTILDTRQLSDLTLEIDWGTFTDVSSDATAWTTEPALKAYVLQSSGIEGPFADSRIFTRTETISASNSQYEVRLPVGKMYRSFMINTTDAGVDSGAIINNLKLRSGPNTFLDISEEILAQVSWLRMGGGQTFSGTAYDDIAIADDTNFSGWYFLDLLSDGLMTEAIDTLGFSEFIMELDLTVGGGATLLNIWPNQIIPVRGARP